MQVACRANAALERCICSASQMAAFDDGDARGTGRADGRHLSTVPSRLVSVWPAVSTTSGATQAPQSAYGGTVRLPCDSLRFAILGRRLGKRWMQLVGAL